MRFPLPALAGYLLAAASTTDVVSSQGTELGGGVVTRFDVEYLADLSLDVRDIAQYISMQSYSAANQVYVDGRNSELEPGFKFSLTRLSNTLSATGVGAATPNYLFHLYGLADRSIDLQQLQDNSLYADTYVRNAIESGHKEAVTAILVLHIWMYATHVLHSGVDTCHKITEADNPQQFSLDGGGMDEFIALWVGTGQEAGGESGSSLYALTELAARHFEGRDIEAPANKKLKLLYQQGAAILSSTDACTKANPGTAQALWNVASQIISTMYTPLVQMLIYSILQKDVLGTQLFAMAVIPQVSQCRPSTFKRLREDLMSGTTPNFDKTSKILMDLQDVYGCFGITCDDVGTYSEEQPECFSSLMAPMAQYQPSSYVGPISQIDLDVLQLRILTSLGSFNHAKIWYNYGRNSPVQRDSENDAFSYYTIADFAVATSRRNADPLYSYFVEYHNDPNYADKIIRNALDGGGKWGSRSVEQRSAIITETSAFHVMYMLALSEINNAVNECKGNAEGGEYELTHPWDEVASLLVGSLEGPDEGGSLDTEDGQLVWGLGNRRAFQFQTENKSGYAKINSRMEDLLFAGKGELDALDCVNLEKTVKSIQNTMLVPLLQSTLRYAIQNNGQDSSSTSADLALGETYALAIIPIIKALDADAATVIETNMLIWDGTVPVVDGPQAVAEALGRAAKKAGVGCESIGSTADVDPCRNVGRSSASTTLQSVGLTLMGVLGAIFLL